MKINNRGGRWKKSRPRFFFQRSFW